MSNDPAGLSRVPNDAVTEWPDLSRFLASHHVALFVLDGPHRNAEYPIRRERTVLGRSRKVDLVFDDDTLSREHAALRYDLGRFVFEDLGSANGCCHNGQSVSKADLVHGDTIQIGRVRMKFILKARNPDSGTQLVEAERDH